MEQEVELIYELSPMQQAMLFHSLYAPGSGIYILQLSLRLTGRLDVPAFERAWRLLLRRHDALRTAFFWEDLEKPLQVVYREVPLEIARESWRGLDADAREARLAAFLDADRERGFDLSAPPLMRLALIELEEGVHQLVWSQHHMVVDGWSRGQLLRELFAAYAAFAEGREPRLERVPGYREHIAWLQRQDPGQAEAFWKKNLAGFTSPTPVAPGDGEGPTYRDSRLRELPLSREASDKLRETARRHRMTLNTLVQGAWALVLAQATGREDVVFGTTVAGRPADLPGVESIVGLFINTLPLRVEAAPVRRLRDWLAEIQRRQVEARRYEHSPLVEVQRWSELPARTPLFDHILVFENLGMPGDLSGALPGLTIEAGAANTLTNYPFNLIVVPESRLILTTLYDAQRFEDSGVDHTLARLAGLLEAFAGEGDPLLGDLPLLLPAERRQLLDEWTAEPGEPLAGAYLHELFAAQAARAPKAVALVHGTQSVTYGELAARAGGIARRLRELGVGPETRVAVCLERSPDLIAALLGVLAAGAAYVPIDPAYPADRQRFMVEDSGASVVLGLEVAEIPDAAWPADTGVTPDNLAYVIYTSGSTGRPKGVAVEHRSAVVLAGWGRSQFSDEELSGVLVSTSVCFDVSVFEIFVPLAWGGRLILAENALELPALPAASEVRIATMVPAAAAELARAGSIPSSVRVVGLGGEPVPSALAARLYEPGTVERVLNLYGPSEDTTYSTVARVPPRGERAPSIGRPVTGARVYVVDRHGALVPPGVPGELRMAGAGLARGYLGRPALTAERFVPDPFGVSGSRAYRTGDLVRFRPDGELEFLGRLDHQVKIRGFRIELGEIEEVLAGHPAVRECAVIVWEERREDVPGLRLLVAYVSGGTVADGDLRAWLGAKLPEYMVPSLFVRLEDLPHTPNGKIDRRALPAPERTAAEAYVAPADPAEELIAEIWAEVLGLARIGVHDSFFALGGHSLLATQVASRVRAALGVELPLRRLFEAPTVRELAQVVRESAGGLTAPPIIPVPRSGDLPLSFAQQRLWFLDQLEPGSPAYNIPAAVRLSGEVSPGRLAGIFAEVVRRHEALRTTFDVRDSLDGGPVQVIAPAGPPPELPAIDLSGLPDPEAAARALALAEARTPFDLARGPLLRLALLRLGEGDHVLLITLHHIVGDGWSVGVLLREIAALASGAALPALAVQYADFAVWQREWLRGEVLEAQLTYWRGRLAGTPRVLDLPLDRPRPAVQTFRGESRPFALPPALSEAVREVCRQEGATPFMVLLAAWALLLGRHAHQEDVLLGTPIAGRNRRETEELIGFFVNTLVMRADLSGSPSFAELVGRVRQAALDGYAHQDVPFERLVEELAPERDLSHPPLFQVLFVLQNAGGRPVTVPGLTLTPLAVDSGVAKFDLTLTLREREDRVFEGALERNADLFDAPTAERLLGRFEALLEALTAEPGRGVAAAPFLLPAERRQLAAWNETGTHPAYPHGLHGLFAAQAARAPEAVAIVHGNRRVTYGELAARAGGIARHLRSLGVGPEARVAVCLERTPDLVAALLGVLAAGAAYVPVDPAYPEDRQRFMVEDSGAAVVLGHAGENVADIPSAPWPADPGAGPGNLAYVIYTSGSTGRPKGVAIEHRSAVALAHWAREQFSDDEFSGVLASTSVCFDVSVFELFAPLAWGGRLILADDALALPSLPAAGEVRVATVVPSAATELARLGLLPPAVRTVGLGGEPLSGTLAAALHATGGVERVLNMYGPSEFTTYSTVAAVPPGERSPAIGPPVRGARTHVVDRLGAPVPPGVVGELWMAGSGLARGYLGRPELTAARFTPDPFSGVAGERVYRTGDLVRHRPDGELEFLGRIDHQVKVRGFRIELGEIEEALRSHDQVRDGVVMAREDVPGSRLLVAYVTGDPAPDAAELRAHLGRRLPEYMVPAIFMALDALPLTPNGKVDRRALPAPGRERRGRGEFIAPRTPTEKAVAEMWKELLGLDRVSVEDGFFELGGYSLLATRLLSRVRQAFGVDLAVREVFRLPTVAGLAARIDEASAALPVAEEDLAELLEQLEHLSDEEAQARLAELQTTKE
jgi:amino acid adenylation domain-containing protein